MGGGCCAQCALTLQDYVLEEVIGGAGEEEDSEPSSEAEAVAIAERLNDRRVQLAGFLKLVLFGVVEMSMAAPVFAQYVKVSATLCFVCVCVVYVCIFLSAALPPLWRPAQDGAVSVPRGPAYFLVQDHRPLLAAGGLGLGLCLAWYGCSSALPGVCVYVCRYSWDWWRREEGRWTTRTPSGQTSGTSPGATPCPSASTK